MQNYRVVLYFSYTMYATSGLNGSSGLGSASNEQIDSNTLSIVNAGLHAPPSFKISKQIPPLY